MDPDRRAEIQRSLRTLTESYTVALKLLEDTLRLLDEEAEPHANDFQRRRRSSKSPGKDQQRLVNPKQLSVTYQGKTCFLGNGLPFKLLARLAEEPNSYVSYEELSSQVWEDDFVSNGAIRSAVKSLRNRLREHDLAALAEAIDGSVPGHYVLRLSL